ncbi:UPF0701 protein yloC [Elysia marginata]|uniref:UPF0701 protein yloC n=1 Tax=Elysia marginata TaxID=1093978 RepID=A0AAV4FWB0_9GAST|nr:UPF0701 protein yloC [Elysia marginata]
MTGYGKADGTISQYTLSVEIKTLNSKFLDVFCKLPDALKPLDLEIRKRVTEKLKRGKVEVSVSISNENEMGNWCRIERDAIENYISQMKEVCKIEEKELFKIAMKLPKSVRKIQEKKELTSEVLLFTIEKVSDAIDTVTSSRKKEGKALETELRLRIENISELSNKVSQYENERVNSVREKLENLLTKNGALDGNKFEQEVLYYIEKMDITEEKVRLQNHLNYFLETLEREESMGKKLGFIAQEIGREINTLGAKSYHSDLQRIVVEMKNELEKVKEQGLNVL